MYLVDTDVLIDASRGSQRAVDYIDGLENGWTLSAVTSLELIVGAKNLASRGGSIQNKGDTGIDTGTPGSPPARSVIVR
jgi:predicted nucleic acid-binding protein